MDYLHSDKKFKHPSQHSNLDFYHAVWYYIIEFNDERSLMRNTRPRIINLYQIPNGDEPFTRWFNSIRDTTVRRQIQARLIAIESGNFGDR